MKQPFRYLSTRWVGSGEAEAGDCRRVELVAVDLEEEGGDHSHVGSGAVRGEWDASRALAVGGAHDSGEVPIVGREL